VRVPTWASARHKGSPWEQGPSAANSAELLPAASMLCSAGCVAARMRRGFDAAKCALKLIRHCCSDRLSA
jgi:hypothetical protein